MAANYVLIREVTLNASAASVTLDNIPQTGYTDLKIVLSARTTTNDGGTWKQVQITFNGLSTNRSGRWLYGTGSGTPSSSARTDMSLWVAGNTATANTFGSAEIYIPNYTSSAYKSSSVDHVNESNSTDALAGMLANLWSSTAAITSVTFTPDGSGSFVAGSSFSLYGIAAVGTTPTVVPKASGGDIVVNDGTYWYHAFLSSGTFVPNTTLSCDALVIAGGGGGGFYKGGGGGAGGFLGFSAQSLTATNYTVTVGAGGAADTGSSNSTKGTNSQLGALTAALGGGIGSGSNLQTTGGSGGGGNYANPTGSAGTVGQGNAGGTTSGGNSGSGGGGAGAVGSGGGSTVGGNGGIGLNTYSSWATATGTGSSGYYSGGGGGGATNGTGGSGGSGGGGNGAASTSANGSAGTINTGGGGGGGGGDAASPFYGYAGGSGIIIVRYAMA